MIKQVAQITPSYTGDTSGVCSALYELGGLVVMHDAAGCNATYSTFDEPRWQQIPSLVFVSGLTETQAIMGDDGPLITDMIQTAQALQPRFIALVGSPIPMVTAIDLPAIAQEIEGQTGIPSLGFNTTGMASYIKGASQAFAQLAQRFVEVPVQKVTRGVNILGLTPLDFSLNGTAAALTALLQKNGYTVVANWAMDTALTTLENSAQAQVNLVVSTTGLKAAQILEARFGIPYVVGLPYGSKMTAQVLQALQQTCQTKISQVVGQSDDTADTVVIGESVAALSLATALRRTLGLKVKVLCPVDGAAAFKHQGCCSTMGEVALRPWCQKARVVIADPLYRPLCSAKTRLIPWPHEAFSGRLYRQEIPNLITDFATFRRKFES